MTQPRRLLVVDDVCKVLSLSRSKVYQLIDSGRLRSVLIDRSRRVPVEAIDEFIAGLDDAR
jgi:excisionase family DNA binding protein